MFSNSSSTFPPWSSITNIVSEPMIPSGSFIHAPYFSYLLLWVTGLPIDLMWVQLSARNTHWLSDDNFLTEYQIIKRQLPLPSVLYIGGNVTALRTSDFGTTSSHFCKCSKFQWQVFGHDFKSPWSNLDYLCLSFLLAFIRVPLNKVEKSSELRPESKQNIYIF